MDLRFRTCGVTVAFTVTEPGLASVLRAVFGASDLGGPATESTLHYRICRNPAADTFEVARGGTVSYTARSVDELLFFVDKDVTIALQRLRADLFFVHAGVVCNNAGAWVLSAPSGTGKSTTVWALICNGMRYASDELAPIHFTDSVPRVHPYPRALHLKSNPVDPYSVPASALKFDERWHIPTSAMSTLPRMSDMPLRGCFFLRREVSRTVPRVTRLTTAQATAHLYANALNPLAHPGMGLDSAVAIAGCVPCFEVELGSMAASAAEIRRCISHASE